MITKPKMLGLLAVAFVAGSFFASPLPQAIAAVIATDVQCSGCVGTTDLAGNAVTAAKIKDGEVKAAEIAANAVGSSEIATDAVGASELQGVSKLIFARCVLTNAEETTSVPAGTVVSIDCSINGVAEGDNAVVTFNDGSLCFKPTAEIHAGMVMVRLHNVCAISQPPGEGSSNAIIVYHK